MLAAYIKPLLFVLSGTSQSLSLLSRVEQMEKQLAEIKDKIEYFRDSDSENVDLQKINAAIKNLAKKDLEFREFVLKKIEMLDKKSVQSESWIDFLFQITSPWYWIRKILSLFFFRK